MDLLWTERLASRRRRSRQMSYLLADRQVAELLGVVLDLARQEQRRTDL